MHVILYTRGEPGIDWSIKNPSQSDITKVFYSVIDPNVALSSSKYSYHCIHCDTYVLSQQSSRLGYLTCVAELHNYVFDNIWLNFYAFSAATQQV